MSSDADNAVRSAAESLFGFLPYFTDKILSMFPPPSESIERLNKSQVRALMLLRRKPSLTATDLGDLLGMTKANLTAIVDELESRGLARRVADPEDRRKHRIDLTAQGRKIADAIGKGFEEALGARLAPLTVTEREAFARYLAALTDLLAKL